jgi:hypothetical protein
MRHATIICKESSSEFYGIVLEEPRKGVNSFGEIIEYWIFQTSFGGDIYEWDCHSDYWTLVDGDKRKIDKVLNVKENKKGFAELLASILRFGVAG